MKWPEHPAATFVFHRRRRWVGRPLELAAAAFGWGGRVMLAVSERLASLSSTAVEQPLFMAIQEHRAATDDGMVTVTISGHLEWDDEDTAESEAGDG